MTFFGIGFFIVRKLRRLSSVAYAYLPLEGAGVGAPALEGADMDADTPRTLSIREAAEYLGKSQKAIRSAVDRGTLPHVKIDGIRRIPVSALGKPAPMGQGQPREAASEATQDDLIVLVDRLTALSEEVGRLRSLSEVSESTEKRLRDELAEARARALSLELQLAEEQAAGGSWFTRRKRRRDGAPSKGAPEALRVSTED